MSAAWSHDLHVLAARTGLKLDTIIRKASHDLFSTLVLKSPVGNPDIWADPKSAPPGYVGGRFRANWNFSVSTPDYTTTLSTNQARGSAEAAKALQHPSGGVVMMSNGLPYARRLEHGWSKQAPYGMVRYSVLEYRRYLLKAIS